MQTLLDKSMQMKYCMSISIYWSTLTVEGYALNLNIGARDNNFKIKSNKYFWLFSSIFLNSNLYNYFQKY